VHTTVVLQGADGTFQVTLSPPTVFLSVSRLTKTHKILSALLPPAPIKYDIRRISMFSHGQKPQTTRHTCGQQTGCDLCEATATAKWRNGKHKKCQKSDALPFLFHTDQQNCDSSPFRTSAQS
jgi:hypothetical protein